MSATFQRSSSDKEAPKPALLYGRSMKRGVSAKWDESNLQENEKIVKELNPQKITEPKTPYHGPVEGDLDAVDPLSLDGDAKGMTAEQHAEFKKHRAEHYRKEAEAMKKAAALQDDDDDEE